MRDGNHASWRSFTAAPSLKPSYEGWKLPEPGRACIRGGVSSLPMRDGNNLPAVAEEGDPLVSSLPMRDGNAASALAAFKAAVSQAFL